MLSASCYNTEEGSAFLNHMSALYLNRGNIRGEERLMTAEEKRQKVVKTYEIILGRNHYSQLRREFCYIPFIDGLFYSDCSSSIALTYKQAGFPFHDNDGNDDPNTVGMVLSCELHSVDIRIRRGLIQNPEVLLPGDMLIFAGNDPTRANVGYAGHVEMVARITGQDAVLYGHGSGTPRAHTMNAYCRQRHYRKANTALGNQGLIKVLRFIED